MVVDIFILIEKLLTILLNSILHVPVLPSCHTFQKPKVICSQHNDFLN